MRAGCSVRRKAAHTRSYGQRRSHAGVHKGFASAIVRCVSIALVVAGLAALVWLNASDWYAQYQADRIISQMSSYSYEEDDPVRIECKRQALLYNKMLAKGRFVEGIKSYRLQLTYDDEPMMSFIEIPKISVRLPIYHGTEDNALMAGVGHLEGSSLPIGGDSVHCVLAGHSGMRNTRMFDDICKLCEGDEFVVWTLGDPYAYRVYDIETVLPEQAARSLGIVKNRDVVTLVTCTPYGVNSHRLLVHAARCEYEPGKAQGVGFDAYVNSRNFPLIIALCALCVVALVGFVRCCAKDAGLMWLKPGRFSENDKAVLREKRVAMKRRHKHSGIVGKHLLNIMLAVVITLGLVPASAFAVATQSPNFALEEGHSNSIESYVIVKTADAAEIEGEPVVSCLGDTYLLSYTSKREAADAADRLSEICEFAEVDRPMMAAANSADTSAVVKGYDEGADPFTITAEAFDDSGEADSGSNNGSGAQGDSADEVAESEDAIANADEEIAEQNSGEIDSASRTDADVQAGPFAVEGSEDEASNPDEEGHGEGVFTEDGDEKGLADRKGGKGDEDDVLLALVDSGAPDSANIVDSISVLGNDPRDENGHAAEVLAAILGQAPNVRVLSVRVLDAQAVGTVAATYAGIKAAVAQGASIVNLSL